MESKALTKGDQWSTSAMSGTLPRAEEPFEMPFSIGQVIAKKFEVTQLLGVGGVGFVVAANHIELSQRVALKFLKPDMLANSQVAGRFAQEALAAARIRSEHVARVFDVGSLEDGTPFIVMEFLDGRDLFDIITQDGPQPIRTAVDYVLQACEALADAHACGIVHRDIKPENLFLLKRSEGIELIKILDFGISKLALTGSNIKSKVPLVKTMLPVGSPVYMSPEQIRASKDIDQRTDIWSIGCVLYELLTGVAAFDAPSLTQLSAAILELNPGPPSLKRPEVSAELDAVVQRCLEKNPNDRFQNVAELAMALYPLGPRRSRIHAERCCRLLKVPGAAHAEFELPSVRPPDWETQPSGAFPKATPVAGSSKRAVMTQDEVATFRPAYRSKKLKVAAFVLLAALGLGAVAAKWRFSDRSASLPEPQAHRAQPVELLSAPPPANVTSAKSAPISGSPVQVSPVVDPTRAAGSGTPSRVSPARPASPQRLAPARPVKGKVHVSEPSSGHSEPDPGF
jgi:serine/threonine-protein kinase